MQKPGPVQKLQLAGEVIEANSARVGTRPAGMDAVDGEALRLESGHLISSKAMSGLITNVVPPRAIPGNW